MQKSEKVVLDRKITTLEVTELIQTYVGFLCMIYATFYVHIVHVVRNYFHLSLTSRSSPLSHPTSLFCSDQPSCSGAQ